MVAFQVGNLFTDDSSVHTSIVRDLCQRRPAGPDDQVVAHLFVVRQLARLNRTGGSKHSNATTWQNTFFNSGTSRMQSVFDASLLFLHFALGSSTDIDLSNTASQLCDSLFKLFTVVVAGAVFHFPSNLIDTSRNVSLLAATFDDGRIVFVDNDFLGLTKIGQFNVLQLNAQVFKDGLTTNHDGDVLQHGLAAIAVSRSLDSSDLESASQLVNHKSRQRFAFDVFGDDQQRFACINNLFQNRNKVLDVADLLFVDQYVRVFHHTFHGFGIGDEIRRQVTSIKLQTFDNVKMGFQAVAFFNRNDAVFANLLHRVGQNTADFRVVVGSHRTNLSNRLLCAAVGCHTLQLFSDVHNSFVHASLHFQRADTGHDSLQAFVVNGFCQHCRGGRSVACNV